jgi:hemerythrin
MVIVWHEELATGNVLIDEQHKEMFRRFNSFQSACKQGKGLDELSGLLAFLGEYVRSHFALEEQLQRDHGYPGFPKHKEEHDGFIRKFQQLEEQLNAEGTTPALLMQTNMALVNWLTRHFTWTDKELADFLHAAVPGRQGCEG